MRKMTRDRFQILALIAAFALVLFALIAGLRHNLWAIIIVLALMVYAARDPG